MADLSTQYLGLALKNPLVPAASPLGKHLDSARRLEDAGAAALVMPSLFEELIERQDAVATPALRSSSRAPVQRYEERYLEHLRALKGALDIPVIASLNGTTDGGWVSYAAALQEAGADALELNVYHIPASTREDGRQVEDRYVTLLEALRPGLTIPVAMKLSPQFSALPHFAQRLVASGAAGLVLFNRFYQPDIDLDTLEVAPQLELSTSEESLLRIRWIAILYGRIDCSLAITGGVHNVRDLIRSLLAGADVAQLCSALLRRGPGHLAVLLRALEQWLEEREYGSVGAIRGMVSQQTATDSAAFLRANYVDVLGSYPAR
jgi:dihydroorotate dehydrogenase (fumarate)